MRDNGRSGYKTFALLAICVLGGRVATGQRMAVSETHSIAIRADGSLWAWGLNCCGQLGAGDKITRNKPVCIDRARHWKSVGVGGHRTYALDEEGRLWACGNGVGGELGNEIVAHLTQVGNDKWLNFAVGPHFTLAVRADSTLWGWGENHHGQLGTGWDGEKYNSRPIQIAPHRKWATVSIGVGEVSNGEYYSVAIASDGSLWYWGNSRTAHGKQVGNRHIYFPAPIQPGHAWRSVFAEYEYVLAFQPDGSLWGWGNNLGGCLAQQDTLIHYTPVQIGQPNQWRSVAAGGRNAFAVRKDGTLWAWGSNSLITGDSIDSNTVIMRMPVQMGTEKKWRTVVGSDMCALAESTDGSL